MSELLEQNMSYWMCFLVLTVGLYGMLMKRNYVKKVIALTVFQAAIILFFVIAAYKDGGGVPVLDRSIGAERAEAYMSPLPHTLMLTAIVVGVATVGMALALLIRIHQGFDTLDEDTLREKMKS
jgi:multicomponent Na+:H+ antiporter subunit C